MGKLKLIAILACLVFLSACGVSIPTSPVIDLGGGTITPPVITEISPEAVVTLPVQCPQATAEVPPVVRDIQSPTDQLSEVVTVTMGFIEEATISTESGTFSGKAEGGQVKLEIKLLPNTIHHLLVTARVKRIESSNGCAYGGYTLSTSTAMSGGPLVIVQGKPGTAAQMSKEVLGVSNVLNWTRLGAIQLTQPAGNFIFINDKEILTYGDGQVLTQFDLASGQQIGTYGEKADYQSAALSADGSWLAAGGRDMKVHLLQFKTGQAASVTIPSDQYYDRVIALAFNPSGSYLAAGTTTNRVVVISVIDQQIIANFPGDTEGFTESFQSVGWLDDDTLVSMGIQHGYRWDVKARKLAGVFNSLPERGAINPTFSLQNGWLGYGMMQGGGAYAYSFRTEKVTALKTGNENQIYSLDFSPDGRLLATADTEGNLYVWDLENGTLLKPNLTSQDVSAVRFSPDGRYLLVLVWAKQSIDLWGVP